MRTRSLVTPALLTLSLLAPGHRAWAERQAAQGGTPTLTASEIDSLVARLRLAAARTDSLLPLPGFSSPADSLDWERARQLSEHARELRLVISMRDRRIMLLRDTLTLLTAPAAVASGMTLDYSGRSWTFRTPRGRHVVRRKLVDPVWTPPDWAYAEVAADHHLRLAPLPGDRTVMLQDGSTLVVKNGVVGVERLGESFAPLPLDEHIVFDSTLYIPPLGSWNRRVEGELGHYALDLGDGYMIHGTPHASSIGRAITHGCIRLRDEDIAWLYQMLPEGTSVYIY